MVLVVGATAPSALVEVGPSMAIAGIMAAAYGLAFGLRAWRHAGDVHEPAGRAFEPRSAIFFALTVGVILLASAWLNDIFGEAGVTISAVVAGFADTHAAAISVASLVASGKLEAGSAVVPILAAFTSNSVTKAVLAWVTGGRSFAFAIWPGLLLVLFGAWLGWGALEL